MKYLYEFRNVIEYNKWDYTKYGVPVLSNEIIEKIALAFLEKYSNGCLYKYIATPIESIIEKFCSDKKINFEIKKLPEIDGKQILGLTDLHKRNIIINESLKSNKDLNTILRMTYAHEIGHCVLHIHKPIFKQTDEEGKNNQIINEIEDLEGNIDLMTNVKYEKLNEEQYIKKFVKSIDWIEHQARYFAAAIMMPMTTILNALIEVQKGINIAKNLGIIYISDDRTHGKDFYKTIDNLSKIYNISKTAIRYRLATFNLIKDKRDNVLSLSKIFSDLINNLND